MDLLSTGAVADLLGVPTHRVSYPVRDRRIRPRKGPTGAFMWSHADVVRLASAMGIEPPSVASFMDAAAQFDDCVRAHRDEGTS